MIDDRVVQIEPIVRYLNDEIATARRRTTGRIERRRGVMGSQPVIDNYDAIVERFHKCAEGVLITANGEIRTG